MPPAPPSKKNAGGNNSKGKGVGKLNKPDPLQGQLTFMRRPVE
jgi:hypothetical protein